MAERFDTWPHDATGIIDEALRDFVGDGEGEDERVLAEHDRAVRAAALREAADATSRPTNGAPYEVWAWCSQWLQRRADRIGVKGGGR